LRSGASRSVSEVGSPAAIRGKLASTPAATSAPMTASSQKVLRHPTAPASQVPAGTPVNSATVRPAVTTAR